MMNATNTATDLSTLWRRQHAHLEPMAAHLPLAATQLQACPLCAAAGAFQVRCHLRFGPDTWVNEASLAFCPTCRSFSLGDALRAQWQQAQPAIAGQVVTAIDARLWSAAPTFLNIEPTTRCNFSCWYCVGRHMEQADIDEANFGRMLDNYPTVKTIALVGEGEPLMHKGFFDMAKQARDRGIRVLAISNGSAFSQSVIEKLCDAEVAYISISIDSIDPKTFAESRIDGELDRVWSGIEKLRQYRDANGFTYPKIGLKGTLFTHTENEMPAIVDRAQRAGVDIFESFQPLNPKLSYVQIYPKAQLAQVAAAPRVRARIVADSQAALLKLQDIQKFCADEGIPASNIGRPNGLRAGCDEEWLYSLLSGDVTPCCQVKQVLDPAWNLFEHPVADILSNPHYENVRFNLWNGLFPDYCSGCSKTEA